MCWKGITDMASQLTAISSMATRLLLQQLSPMCRAAIGIGVDVESVGGVDATRRVQAGEPFDLVFLANDAIDKLIAAERVVAGSRVDIARSGVAVAVRAGATRPRIDTEESLKSAVRNAATIGYSTGPSGVALQKLFERWGIASEIVDRIVQAKPGVPVGSMVADGRIELGFQQLSELMHVEGIEVVGPLPPSVQVTTVFSGGVTVASGDRDAAAKALAFMTSSAAADAIRAQGMEPV